MPEVLEVGVKRLSYEFGVMCKIMQTHSITYLMYGH